MTIDLNFLMFLIALIGGILGIFAFFWRMFCKIMESSAKTEAMIAEMKSEIKNTKEFHTCEFNRIDKAVADMDAELDDHERRIVKLEAKCK